MSSMTTVEYDLDSSGGLMAQILALTAPHGSRERKEGADTGLSAHPYFKRPGRGHNRDCCDACGEGGDLICCDLCPASFHLICHDPPLFEEDIPHGEWGCYQCRTKLIAGEKSILLHNCTRPGRGVKRKDREDDRYANRQEAKNLASGTDNRPTHDKAKSTGEKVNTTEEAVQKLRQDVVDDFEVCPGMKVTVDGHVKSFGSSPLLPLIKQAVTSNSEQFVLPYHLSVPFAFPGESKGPVRINGKRLHHSKKKPSHEKDNGLVQLPAKLCYACNRSCRVGALLACDYCPLLFHLDCLDPPLTTAPTHRWMCPVHPEHFLEQHMLTSCRITERVSLWERCRTLLDETNVQRAFFNRIHRPHPPRRFKQNRVLRCFIKVPETIKQAYKNPAQKFPSLPPAHLRPSLPPDLPPEYLASFALTQLKSKHNEQLIRKPETESRESEEHTDYYSIDRENKGHEKFGQTISTTPADRISEPTECVSVNKTKDIASVKNREAIELRKNSEIVGDTSGSKLERTEYVQTLVNSRNFVIDKRKTDDSHSERSNFKVKVCQSEKINKDLSEATLTKSNYLSSDDRLSKGKIRLTDLPCHRQVAAAAMAIMAESLASDCEELGAHCELDDVAHALSDAVTCDQSLNCSKVDGHLGSSVRSFSSQLFNEKDTIASNCNKVQSLVPNDCQKGSMSCVEQIESTLNVTSLEVQKSNEKADVRAVSPLLNHIADRKFIKSLDSFHKISYDESKNLNAGNKSDTAMNADGSTAPFLDTNDKAENEVKLDETQDLGNSLTTDSGEPVSESTDQSLEVHTHEKNDATSAVGENRTVGDVDLRSEYHCEERKCETYLKNGSFTNMHWNRKLTEDGLENNNKVISSESSMKSTLVCDKSSSVINESVQMKTDTVNECNNVSLVKGNLNSLPKLHADKCDESFLGFDSNKNKAIQMDSFNETIISNVENAVRNESSTDSEDEKSRLNADWPQPIMDISDDWTGSERVFGFLDSPKLHTETDVTAPEQKSYQRTSDVAVPARVGLYHASSSAVPTQDSLRHMSYSTVPAQDSLYHASSSAVPTQDCHQHTSYSAVPAQDSLQRTSSSTVPAQDSLQHTSSFIVPAQDGLQPTSSSVVPAQGSLQHTSGSTVTAQGSLQHTSSSTVPAHESLQCASGATCSVFPEPCSISKCSKLQQHNTATCGILSQFPTAASTLPSNCLPHHFPVATSTDPVSNLPCQLSADTSCAATSSCVGQFSDCCSAYRQPQPDSLLLGVNNTKPTSEEINQWLTGLISFQAAVAKQLFRPEASSSPTRVKTNSDKRFPNCQADCTQVPLKETLCKSQPKMDSATTEAPEDDRSKAPVDTDAAAQLKPPAPREKPSRPGRKQILIPRMSPTGDGSPSPVPNNSSKLHANKLTKSNSRPNSKLLSAVSLSDLLQQSFLTLKSGLHSCYAQKYEEVPSFDPTILELLAMKKFEELQIPTTPPSSTPTLTPPLPCHALMCPLIETPSGLEMWLDGRRSEAVPQPVQMMFRQLTIGRGNHNDVNLEDYGHCNFVSRRHACILLDEFSGQYELLSYSQHGTEVDGGVYRCDQTFERTTSSPLSTMQQQVRELVEKHRLSYNKNGADNYRFSLGKFTKKEQKEEVEPMMTAHPNKELIRCCCPPQTEENTHGWEGPAVLRHGSMLRFGCLKFVFSVVETAHRGNWLTISNEAYERLHKREAEQLQAESDKLARLKEKTSSRKEKSKEQTTEIRKEDKVNTKEMSERSKDGKKGKKSFLHKS